MLPSPILPLAEHASLGQNCFDASIGSVWFCISYRMPVDTCFFKSSFPFHRLVVSYPLSRAFQYFPGHSRYLKCIAHPGFLTSAFVARKIQHCPFKVCIYPNSNSTYGIASFIYVSSCFTIYLYDVLLYTTFPINAARVPMCPQIRHGEPQFAGDESRKRVIFEITAAVL